MSNEQFNISVYKINVKSNSITIENNNHRLFLKNMDMHSLPQFSDFDSNNSAKFVNAVLSLCTKRLDLVNNDKNNWQIYINFYRFFVSWFVPLLIMFGEIGTLLCLIVLLKRRTGNAETRMWFIALSIADMYSLIVGLSIFYSSRVHFIFPSLFTDDDSHQFDMRHRSSFNCFLLNGMVYFGLLVSTWIQVGISVLRVLSVKSKTPNQNSRKTKKYAIALGVCIVISIIVTCILIGVTFEYNYPQPCPVNKICRLRSNAPKYFFYISLIIKVLLPTAFLLGCSIVIINHLKKFKRRFSNRENGNFNNINSIIRKRVKQKYISYTLLGMNFTFFLLTLPFEVFKIFYFYNSQRITESNVALIRTIDKLLNIILYANNATNWLFYFMLGQRFRQSMVNLICQKYSINCTSFMSTFRRLNTSLRSNRRTKTTPVPCTAGKQTNKLLKPTESPEEMFTLVASQPKFHCTFPAAQNTFPKFY